MAEARVNHKMMAKCCEQAERYEDMVKEMTDLIKTTTKEPLDEEERNLLSVGYKNIVGSRRTSWRVLSSRFAEEEKSSCKAICGEMKENVEKELNKLCGDVLQLITDHLLPNPENIQAEIFFYKMRGDYLRYMVEICDAGPARDELASKAETAYQKAFDVAKEQLPPTSPIRLGLALNYSVFFYEIKNNPTGACELAKTAFDDAIAEIDDVTEDVYKDSTLIMQLLRDNLTLWKSELEEVQDD